MKRRLIYSTRKTRPPLKLEPIKLSIADSEKEIYESAGAKIIVLEAQGMSTAVMAIIEQADTKKVICRLVKMFSPIKNHA